jgi:hypothetical protein
MALSCAAVLYVWWRTVRLARTRAGDDRGFGLTLIAMMLLSPITWEHYFLILALPLIQLWIVLPRTDLGKMLRLVLLACLWVDKGWLWRVFLPDTLFRAGSASVPITLVTLLSYQNYLLLALFAVGISSLEAERSSGGDPEPWAAGKRPSELGQIPGFAPACPAKAS